MPDALHVVTCISNPLRWKSRARLFQDFQQHMLDSGADLTVVECVHGDRWPELEMSPHARHVLVRANTMTFHKENLINIGMSRLPHGWREMAWIDADIRFRDDQWVEKTLHELALYHVVQPWTHCYDLGPNGGHMQVHKSFAAVWRSGSRVVPGPGYEYAHPGYAWAARRTFLEATGGLIDTAILGAADHHMALSIVGEAKMSWAGGLTEGYRAPILRWQQRALQETGGAVGVVDGTIEHFWHGTKASRKYVERWDILKRNAYDPATDIIRNVWGVVDLAGNKPALRRDIEAYFRQRNEDLNGDIR